MDTRKPPPRPWDRRRVTLVSLAAFTVYAACLWGIWMSAVSDARAAVAAEVSQAGPKAKKSAEALRVSLLSGLRHVQGISAVVAADPDLIARTRGSRQALDHRLREFAQRLNVGVLWLLDETGLCIAASNAGMPESFVGINYADREYFEAARSRRFGYQYAVGRKSNIPGLFFSAPVYEESGQVVGAVIVKVELPDVTWASHIPGFITDKNGVVILAHDKTLERQALSGAQALEQPPQLLNAVYKQTTFKELAMPAWANWPQASSLTLENGLVPVVTSTVDIPEYSLKVTAYETLPQLLSLEADTWASFKNRAVLLTLLLIVTAVIAAFLYAKAQTARALAALAFFDPLTRLPNRRMLFERIDHCVKISERTPDLAALLYIDLDGFKGINDSHGHQAGDRLLKSVAYRLKSIVRGGDTVARLGGDEFVVVAERVATDLITAQAAARAMAVKLLETLNAPHSIKSGAAGAAPLMLRCGASVGVVIFRTGGASAVIHQADAAMYRAKRSGKSNQGGSIVFAEPLVGALAKTEATEAPSGPGSRRDDASVGT